MDSEHGYPTFQLFGEFCREETHPRYYIQLNNQMASLSIIQYL